MTTRYTQLAIADAADLMFGHAPKPVTTRKGLDIGGGKVYPELNFTLPTMELSEDTWPQVRRHYEQIVQGALKRASELGAPGLVLECETLPPMTHNPLWAEEICKVLLDGIEDAHAKHGLVAALRMTPNDNREMVRPPVMRSGPYWGNMIESFERCAALGADLLSIESVGGKEVHDDALTMCNIRHVIFALCIMGTRDMRFLWTRIAEIAKRNNVHAAGDTACGFGNTAMVLAEKGMIPRTFAAVVRAVTAVRSLAAYECGAVGPGKDCGYENPILKAITGSPMAMEGKSATCAHLSPVGNIAGSTCDLWSNESVQHLRLLADMAPTCYFESLEYDCRLFNRASADGPAGAATLQRWLVESDAPLDPQAWVLSPRNAVLFAKEIVAAPSDYHAGRNVALSAVRSLSGAYEAGLLRIPDREVPYLAMIEADLLDMPDSEDAFIAACMDEVDLSKFIPAEYEL